MKKGSFRTGQAFGQWKLVKRIGMGGNGEVWSAQKNKNNENNIYAIKLLKKIQTKSYLRFIDEINILLQIKDIGGILPIIDYYLPQKKIRNVIPWYVMHLAIQIDNYLKKEIPEKIIEATISYAKTLKKLHHRNIFHRDIKPANLFFLDDEYVIGDFGLVDFPHKNNVTSKGEEIGAKWTKAPEMRRNPKKAKGGPADIYSLAKTLWILLTRQYKCFDGQYSKNSIISLGKFIRGLYTSRIDDLLHNCTDNDPTHRLTAGDFIKGLTLSLKENKEYEAKTKKQWKDLIQSLFPQKNVSRAIWEGEPIPDVLTCISSIRELTHIIFPTGGGLNLLDIKISFEKDCIELCTDAGSYITKPKRLIFDSFSSDNDWDYFRLESDPLNPISLNKGQEKRFSEALTELRPGEYTIYECWEHNDFNAMDLPQTARSVVRFFRGDFLIVRNTSNYLKIPDFYRGIHNKMSADEFKNVIQRLSIKKSYQKEINIIKKMNQIKFIFPKKYKKSPRNLSERERLLVEKIIKLAKKRNQEEGNLKERYEISHIILPSRDVKQDKYLAAARPEEKKLENFLRKFNKKEIALIAAVMYGGREFRPPFRAVPLDELIHDLYEDKFLVEMIMEKTPLDEYLEQGLEAY